MAARIPAAGMMEPGPNNFMFPANSISSIKGNGEGEATTFLAAARIEEKVVLPVLVGGYFYNI